MGQKQLSISDLEQLTTKTIGHDLLRYVGLPAILGHEKDTLLYFLGRNMARQVSCTTIDDIIYVFKKMNWGNLELIKQKRHQSVFHLMADDIVHRLQSPIETEFRLEAGFIAESLQQIQERASECTETINQRLYRIEFKTFFVD